MEAPNHVGSPYHVDCQAQIVKGLEGTALTMALLAQNLHVQGCNLRCQSAEISIFFSRSLMEDQGAVEAVQCYIKHWFSVLTSCHGVCQRLAARLA